MGNFEHLDVREFDHDLNPDTTATLVWVSDGYDKYKLRPDDVHVQHCNMFLSGMCLNFSSKLSGYRNYIFHIQKAFVQYKQKLGLRSFTGRTKRQHKYLSTKSFNLVSWLEGSHQCKNKSAHLPFFSSQEDLDDFGAVLKIGLQGNIPPLESIYIALSSLDKVCASLNCV